MKVNSISITNSNLVSMGERDDDKCIFSNQLPGIEKPYLPDS